MAKLSESKKVELLEESVLNNDLEKVKEFMTELKPIEFTAKALGLACRFSGAEMVKLLIDNGATLSYELTPNLKRKYDCRIAINKTDDMPINFSKYLFPQYEVEGYLNKIIDDPERIKVLDILYENNMGDFQELLYWAILYRDDLIFNELIRLGVKKLSEYRTDIVGGRVPNNYLNSFGRYDRAVFQRFIHKYDGQELKTMLNNFLSCMSIDKITLFLSDFYERDWATYAGKEKFISKFCSEELFDFFVKKTSMVDKVKKWDLMLGIIEQNNPSAMQYALNEKWLSKPKEIDELFEYAQSKKDITPEFLGYILEKKNESYAEILKSVEETLTLEDKPLSAAELKKLWGTKKLDDGTLMITSYKGDEQDVIIPEMIGKAKITAIDSEAFSPDAPRLNPLQQKARKEITSVVFPGTIVKIPSFVFGREHDKLKSVLINEGTTEICAQAFSDCSGLEEVSMPNSIEKIGDRVFYNCKALSSANMPEGITIGENAFCRCDSLADDTGKIIVQENLYDLYNPIGGDYLSKELQISPLILGDDIKNIDIEIYRRPQIICRQHSSSDALIDVDSISVGEEVSFGRFPAEEDYIVQPLKWKVLAKENGAALLITEKNIMGQQYNTNWSVYQTGTWEESYLRELLNEGFLNVAFTEKELMQIQGGPETEDKAFLLSIDEVEKYMDTEESRKSEPTEYAAGQIAFNFGSGERYWLLRTMANGKWDSVAVSNESGEIDATGSRPTFSNSDIRPAIWVKNVK